MMGMIYCENYRHEYIYKVMEQFSQGQSQRSESFDRTIQISQQMARKLDIFNKIYNIYQITKQQEKDITIETYTKDYICKKEIEIILAREKNLINNPQIQPLNSNKIYCLANYPINVLTYLQKNKRHYGIPWVEIQEQRDLQCDPKILVNFEALGISAEDYLKQNIRNIQVVKDLVIKINQSLNALAKLQICVFKRYLSNLRIKMVDQNEIQVKNIDFTYTLMFSSRVNVESQRQLLKHIKSVISYQRKGEDFVHILKELSTNYSTNLLDKFYGIYYQQIIKQIVQRFEQNQLNQDQKQFVKLLKSYQFLGDNSRNKFIQKLKESFEKNKSKNYTNFTKQSLSKIYKKYRCFKYQVKPLRYEQDVVHPILFAIEKKKMNIKAGQLKDMKIMVGRMEQFASQLEQQNDRQEFNDMLELIKWQVNQNELIAINVAPTDVSSIQREKSARNTEDSTYSYYTGRRKQIFIEDKVLSNSILTQQYRQQFKKIEEEPIKIQLKKQQQRQINLSNISKIDMNEMNDNSLIDNLERSFLQNIASQQSQYESINIFKKDLLKATYLSSLDQQDDKMKQFHNKLSQLGLQERSLALNLIEKMNFKRIDKDYNLIFQALQQKYEKIRHQLLNQSFMLNIMRTRYYKCSINPKTVVKNLKLVVGTYFKHQYDKVNNVQRILEGDDNRDLKMDYCKRLIQEVKYLIRKFKEDIILQAFSDTQYLRPIESQSKSFSKANSKEDENYNRQSSERQRQSQSNVINRQNIQNGSNNTQQIIEGNYKSTQVTNITKIIDKSQTFVDAALLDDERRNSDQLDDSNESEDSFEFQNEYHYG